MRDYKWLFNVVGLAILISVLYIGLKKVVSFIIDITTGVLIAFGMVFIFFMIAYIICEIMVILTMLFGIPTNSCLFPFVGLMLLVGMIIAILGSIVYISRD
jgi:hypothetical protein